MYKIIKKLKKIEIIEKYINKNKLKIEKIEKNFKN